MWLKLGVSAWSYVSLAALLAVPAAEPPAATPQIPVVELVGVVHAVTAGHVVAAIEKADAQGAPLLVLRLDTPGGLDTSMRQIIDKMLNCRTPVAVFVGPSGARADSAGFLITIVADVAAMAPGTSMGAAHPVSGMGQMDEVMSKKVTSATAAYIRGKAARRGRNEELAEKAVVESRSFTEKEALEGKLIDLVVKDVPELVAALDGREIKRFDGSKLTLRLKDARLATLEMNWRQAVLSAIARPEVLFLLLLGALAGLGTEISHPGLLFPGIFGTVCLILFLFATQIIPVNWAGVMLILLAIALFVAEVKVASYGLLTVGGLAAMILGAMMLVDAPIPEMRVSLRTVMPAVVVTAALTALLVRLVIAAQRRRSVTGEAGMLGQVGVADDDLAPEGWVRIAGEKWRAVADGPVARGERVTVTGLVGLTLKVRKGA
jgi:membrane-bound serine protease (ClpP class)